ncbi:MAG TPA: hypothetical protein VIY08_02815 [Candidatus Nitrosocosmicus sp.]
MHLKKRLVNGTAEEIVKKCCQFSKNGLNQGKPMKVMHDGGREFTSNKFKNYLVLNGIIDKQIPKGYPQEQGKVEAYNKIVIAEFLQVEELIDEKDGIEKYESFVNSYNYEREHGRINGMTPSEKFIDLLHN